MPACNDHQRKQHGMCYKRAAQAYVDQASSFQVFRIGWSNKIVEKAPGIVREVACSPRKLFGQPRQQPFLLNNAERRGSGALTRFCKLSCYHGSHLG
jgi:hypothetical protein